MFHCRFCTFTSTQLKHYLVHSKIHSNLNPNLFCGFNRCKKLFRLEVSLRSHLLRSHNFQLKPVHKTIERTFNTRPTNTNAKYTCSATLCKKEFDQASALIKHVKSHMKENLGVQCPFHGCNKIYNKPSSFTSHLTKCHRHRQTPDIVCVADANSLNEQNLGDLDDFQVEYSDGEDRGSVPMVRTPNVNANTQNNQSSTDSFLLHLAQFFLKLESQFLIPVSTMQYIISQTCSIHDEGQEVIKNNILLRLHQENLSSDIANHIVNQVFLRDPFSNIKATFGTKYKRREFYKKHFPYVKPVKVWLGDKRQKSNFFHYIPLRDTLVQLFKNKSLQDELKGGFETDNGNVLKDFTDGSIFKENIFFRENPTGLKLILYQDSFEVVNPIGSAKNKYKILAVYLSIGNLPCHIRSHTNSMQLVALCREKLFDHAKVHGRIVKDLKHIETEGVELNSGEIIKGSLVFIAGDNLGSHSLGGFIENFSTSTYFCRYCLMRRDEFYTDDGATKIYERRTISSYKKIIEHLDKNQHIKQSTKKNFDCKGIKFNSVFNDLKYFHVCTPGLPPCLGHDVLEGLIAYDLLLYIKDLVKEKWFSYETLNNRINSFNYSITDRRDKPCNVTPTVKKITGGAWQLWTFLRLLPLLIHDKIQEIHNDVWKCILLLTEITEIIIAPEIHKSCITYLHSLIVQYINLRQRLPQPLRPKHHYLMHYVELILQFGPLMKVWTLRFDSKHTFFKRVIRFIKNYMNVTKSLSIKHELFQSFVRSGGDIRFELEMKSNTNFNPQHYDEKIQKAVNSMHLPCEIQECNEIIVKGVSYRKGDALFVAQSGYQYQVEVGRVILLLCDENHVFVVVEVLETLFRPYLRTYELGNFVRYECLPLESLPSTEKLNIYNMGTFLCVKPNYGLVGRNL